VNAFGTAGEGGAVVTDDPDLARRVRMLRNHGQDGTNWFLHHRFGDNRRFDEIFAAFQRRRLAGLAGRLDRRAGIAEYYTERFAELGDRGVVAPPPGRNGRCHYVYSLLVDRRDELREHLTARGSPAMSTTRSRSPTSRRLLTLPATEDPGLTPTRRAGVRCRSRCIPT
jgi:dTDP-4-amino-4,6-dideoxygalactose transaminase